MLAAAAALKARYRSRCLPFSARFSLGDDVNIKPHLSNGVLMLATLEQEKKDFNDVKHHIHFGKRKYSHGLIGK